MKACNCRFVEDSIWRYVDRELSARQVAEISLHLRSCADCSRLYEARARESALYRAAFAESPFGDRFAERFGERLMDEVGEDVAGGRSRVPAAADAFTFNPTLSHRRWAVALSVAAMALVAVLGWFLRSGGGRPDGPPPVDAALGVYRGAERGIVVTRSGGEPVPAGAILPGDRYRLLDQSREIHLELRDGSRIAFGGGPGEFVIDAGSRAHGSFSGRLQAGRLDAEVTPRARGQLFEIATPNAIVQVVGTRFRVAVEEGEAGIRTELTVEEGTVRLIDSVAGGESLVSAEDGVRRIIGPPSRAGIEGPPAPLGPGADPRGPESASGPAPAPPSAPESAPAPEPAPAPVFGPSSTLDQPSSTREHHEADNPKR